MWEVRIVCEACGGKHDVHTTSGEIPRAFSFDCPDTNKLVEMRFRDPSMIVRPWADTKKSSPGSLTVVSAEIGGSFDI